MDMDRYQLMSQRTAVYPDVGTGSQAAVNYCIVGLCGEVGEIANKWKKVLRGDSTIQPDIASEIGDVLWYLARLSEELGYFLSVMAEMNLAKLKDRKARDALQGSGDDR